MKTIQKHWRWWMFALAALGMGVVVRADNPCIPTTSWCNLVSCAAGSVSNPGTLSRSNDTICLGGASGAVASGASFNYGQKTPICQDDCGNSWAGLPALIAYAATNWWEPPLPAAFNSGGTFLFTNKVKGLSLDSECPDPTEAAVVGTLTVTVISDPPAIATQPTNQTVARAGETVVLQVAVEGCGPFSYQWKTGGVALVEGGRLSGSKTARLQIDSVRTEDAAFYTVEVSNSGGKTVSERAALVVCRNPGYENHDLAPKSLAWQDAGEHSLAFHFDQQKTIVGYKASASASVLGLGGLSGEGWGSYWTYPRGCTVAVPARVVDFCAWPEDAWCPPPREPLGGGYLTTNRFIPQQGYELTGVRSQDYTFTFGLSDYLYVWVTVAPIERVFVLASCEGPPVIEVQPADQTLPRGSVAALAAGVTGTQPMAYQWQLNGVDIPGATQATFSASPIENYLGLCRVRVRNVYGEVVSQAARLALPPPPPPLTITGQPKSQRAGQTGTVSFSVVAVGVPPLSYQWRHNGADIPGATQATLPLANVLPADGGSYNVLVSDSKPASVTSVDATLTVQAFTAPVIYRNPQSQEQVQGDSAMFEVIASGYPTPTYQWYKGSQLVSGATLSSIIVAAAAPPHEEVYKVVVGNIAGSVTSAEATLTVVELPQPVIASGPDDAKVSVGSPVTLSVQVRGRHPMTYQWWHDGAVVEDCVNTSLILPKAQLYHAGDYSVVVVNSAGTATSRTAHLTVETNGPPKLTKVDPLNLPADNGSYGISLEILATNSDAANFTMFVVDEVSSGALMINGDPFTAKNNTIRPGTPVVWTPPAFVKVPIPPAFTVHVSDGTNGSAPPVAVNITQRPRTRLYGWGRNDFAQLGNGVMYQDPYRLTKESLDWQTTNGIVVPDAKWRFQPAPWRTWWEGGVFPPSPVLDLQSVRSMRVDQWNVSAVSGDGQLWQWGSDRGCSPFVFGRPFAQALEGDKSYLWAWGEPLSSTATLLYPGLTAASPLLFETPFKERATEGFADVRSICGGSIDGIGWRVALKEDGTLWSWGSGSGGKLGRPLDEKDDLVLLGGWQYGASPRRVYLPVDASNRERVAVEVQSSSYGTMARCDDNSVWWWGTMGAESDYGFCEIPEFGGGPPDRPARLTCFDTADPTKVVTQISAAGNHYVVLKADGSVWEIGYIPSRDLSGIVGVGMNFFYATGSHPAPEAVRAALSATPVQVAGLPSNIKLVSAGDGAFGAAVTTDGNVYVWGHVLPERSSIAPKPIPSLKKIVKLAAGYQALLALDERGRVWGWGENLYDLFGPSADLDWTGEANLHEEAMRVQGIENATDIFCNAAFGVAFAVGTAEDGRPTGLVAFPMDAKVKLQWNIYPGAGEYLVQRSLVADGGFEDIAHTTGNSYTDAGPLLQNEIKYYYRVVGVVDGIPSLPSIEVGATPLARPGQVTGFSVVNTLCGGVRLSWNPPANAKESPPLAYRVKRSASVDGTYELIAALKPSARTYRDATSGTWFYHVAAWNNSGEGAGILPTASGSAECLPAPTIATDLREGWLEVSRAEAGSDRATLRWTGPDPAATAAAWPFQAYEFKFANLDGFIGQLKNSTQGSATWDPAAWVWSHFSEGERGTLANDTVDAGTKQLALVAALNRIISGPAVIPAPQELLCPATTTALNTPGLPVIRLNRMILDDCFRWDDYFRSGPNWGEKLKSFRITYRLKQAGGLPEKTYQREILVQAAGSAAGRALDSTRTVNAWEYAWPVPSGARCWAKVSAIVDGEQGSPSIEVGPVAAPFGQSTMVLTAKGGYHQVYLQWSEDLDAVSYQLVYSLKSNADPNNPADWNDVTDATGLTVNCFWDTGLPPGVERFYKVVAARYDGKPATSGVVGATPTSDASQAPMADPVFSAWASPYDSMVFVEWAAPMPRGSTSLPPPDSQTGWQFYLERKVAGAAPYERLTDIGFGLAYLDPDAANGTAYQYRVTAIDQYFNRYVTTAVLKTDPAKDVVTPSENFGFKLTATAVGNGYVDLGWSPIRANAFTVKHSLSRGGPFEVLNALLSDDYYNNAQVGYRHSGIQNGVDHYYVVTATLPDGEEKDSDIIVARPLSTLRPLPPAGFKAEQVVCNTFGKVLLTWRRGEGPVRYQVFLKEEGGRLVPLHQGDGTSQTSLGYPVPEGTADGAEFVFAIRSVNQDGQASDLKETRLVYAKQEGAMPSPVVKVLVAGCASPLTVIAPTNLTLSLDAAIGDGTQVTYYDGAEALGTVEAAPFHMIWHGACAGQHFIKAVVQVARPPTSEPPIPAGKQNDPTFETATVEVNIKVKPELTAYQTSATDLQVSAPGLPIVLSRSYSSRDASLSDASLGVGWQASWKQASLKVSSDLIKGWKGTTQAGQLGLPMYYIGESVSHTITVTLPGGGSAQFSPQPQFRSQYYSWVDPGGYYFVVGNRLLVSMDFLPYDSGEGALSWNVSSDLRVSLVGEFSDWASSTFTIGQGVLSVGEWTYVAPDGVTYRFGKAGSDSLTWLLTSMEDRNGNRLGYNYADGKVSDITHSCGRKVSFTYSTPSPGTDLISVCDNSPAGSDPVVTYVIVNNQLSKVQRLRDRTTPVTLDETVYHYGSTGADANRLTEVIDPRGVRVLLNAYTGDPYSTSEFKGDLLSQTDAAGRTTTWALDTSSFTLTLKRNWTNNGAVVTRQVTVNHDGSGAVSGIARPEDVATGGTAQNSSAERYTYDGRGRLVAQTDAAENSKYYGYDGNDRLTSQSDELGHTTSSVLNEYGQVTSTTNANGNPAYFTYDRWGNLLSSIDTADTRTECAYWDPVMNGSTQVLPRLLKSETKTAVGVPYRIVTENGYNGQGDLCQVTQKWIEARGKTVGAPVSTSYGYDENGNRTSEVRTRRDLDGHLHTISTEYVLDAQYRPVVTTIKEKVEPGTEFVTLQTTRTTYNAIGKQKTTTDAANRETSYVYDAMGNLVETSYPDHTVSRTVYDENNHPWIVQGKAIPADTDKVTIGPATRTTYDASGRAVMVERLSRARLSPATVAGQPAFDFTDQGSDQVTARTAYDKLGRVQYSMDARGAVTESIYDAAGRRTTNRVYTAYTVSPLATGVIAPSPTNACVETSYAYDAAGNQVGVTDALGRTSTSVYDGANRVVQVRHPATDSGPPRSRFTSYDGLGRRILETDEAGVSTAYVYDFRGLLIQVALDAGGHAQRTSYQYDETGNLVAQTDANNHTTRFDYDALGRRVRRVLPDNQTETAGYDASGNLVRQTNFSGVVITNEYDGMGRLTGRTSVNGYQVGYGYSALGLRTSMTDATGSTGWGYDELNRLRTKTVIWGEGMGVTLNYDYDGAGSLTNLWSSNAGGVSLAYGYDTLGRITNVLADGGAAAGYGYDRVGNLQVVSYGNGMTNLYEYDGRNRLTNLVAAWNGSGRASYAYLVGPAGNRTNLVERVNGTGRTYDWAYDTLYRLTKETFGGGSSGVASYGLDGVGNRTGRSSTVAGVGNQALSYTANDWVAGDGMDANGNTTASAGNVYYYDPLNRLVGMNKGAVTVGYDGDGNRVSKTAGGVTTYYLVDDRNPSGYAQVLEEWVAVGGTTNLGRVYNYGLQLISQRQGAGGAVSYYGLDGHGSVRFLADAGGGITDTYAYDAYGIQIGGSGTTPNSYRYCGEQWDADLGMYYLRARYYRPETGRFWTMDSHEGNQEDPLSLHKYVYCQADPVNGIDPTGHEDLIGLMCALVINMDVRAMKETGTVVAKQASTAPVFDVYVGLAPMLPFGHSGIFINNRVTDRGWLFHVLPRVPGSKSGAQDGMLVKDEHSLRGFKTGFPINKRFTRFNAIQYVFWQQEVKFLAVDDDFGEVPVRYSQLGFDIFLREPYSCHSWTIKAGLAAFITSKIK